MIYSPVVDCKFHKRHFFGFFMLKQLHFGIMWWRCKVCTGGWSQSSRSLSRFGNYLFIFPNCRRETWGYQFCTFSFDVEFTQRNLNQSTSIILKSYIIRKSKNVTFLDKVMNEVKCLEKCLEKCLVTNKN